MRTKCDRPFQLRTVQAGSARSMTALLPAMWKTSVALIGWA